MDCSSSVELTRQASFNVSSISMAICSSFAASLSFGCSHSPAPKFPPRPWMLRLLLHPCFQSKLPAYIGTHCLYTEACMLGTGRWLLFEMCMDIGRSLVASLNFGCNGFPAPKLPPGRGCCASCCSFASKASSLHEQAHALSLQSVHSVLGTVNRLQFASAWPSAAAWLPASALGAVAILPQNFHEGCGCCASCCIFASKSSPP